MSSPEVDLSASFYFGAALVLVYQTTKFNEIDHSDVSVSKYKAVISDLRVTDFAGRTMYFITLGGFLVVSLLLYYFVCRLSPHILHGALKVLAKESPEVEKLFAGFPYPLYVAALFIGLTQPIVPIFAKFTEFQRNFFHGRIDVPGRLIDFAETVIRTIKLREGDQRANLSACISKLVDPIWLNEKRGLLDVSFFDSQLKKLAREDLDVRSLDEMSNKELTRTAERVVLYALIAGMRKSGPRGMMEVAKYLGVEVSPYPFDLGYFVATGIAFSIGILVIWHVLFQIGEPIAHALAVPETKQLWPKSLQYAGQEVVSVSTPIVLSLLVSVYIWSRAVHVGENWFPTNEERTGVDLLVSAVQIFAPILAVCIFFNVAANIALTAYTYSVGELNVKIDSLYFARKLLLFFMQSLIPLGTCLITLLRLEGMRGVITSPPMGASVAGIVASGVVFAGLYGITSVHIDRPEDLPGWDWVLFSILANVLISLCAFVSATIFLRKRSEKREATPGIRATAAG